MPQALTLGRLDCGLKGLLWEAGGLSHTPDSSRFDIVKGLRILLQGRINKSQWPLARRKTFLHEVVDEHRKDRSGS